VAGRAKAVAAVTVDRKPEEVFSYLADVTRHPEWSPKTLRVEGLAEGPTAVGSKWTSTGWIPRDPEHRNEAEVTEYQPPSRFVYTAHEKEGEFINIFVLAPEGDGTRVERTLDMPKPPGFFGLIFPVVIATFLRPALQKGMNQFKLRMEEQPA
jgi:uncharacterized protein YndB with AHSA1/START domain